MAPVVEIEELDWTTGRINKYKASIIRWYENFSRSDIMTANNAAARKYREELFGPAPLESTPDLYSDYAFFKAVGITEDAYDALDIHTRARMRAYHYLSNIVQLRETHKQKMKEARERKAQELKAAAEERARKK